MKRGVFVTGTDTGVGKTLACCALLHALAARGVRAVPMKPIAAGAVERAGRWINEDTALLLEAAGRDLAEAEACTPVLLREPLAPHIAAEREGVHISMPLLVAAFELRAGGGEFVVVEGVGGFRVPLSGGADTVQLARLLGLPVVLVVGLRLGCLNHALLTAQAIDDAHLPLAGWIANSIDPNMAAAEENIAALVARLEAPLLGRMPFTQRADARALAAHLDVTALLLSP
jgi:dethiobiotin synthetase